MPIPGDNGNQKAEREAQETRIRHVANYGACVQKEVNYNPPAPEEKNVFGVMHK
jgi:hypothetical protein